MTPLRWTPALLILALTGCTQLTVQNGPADAEGATYRTGQWHHALLYDSLEISRPIDPRTACQHGDWQSVRTRHSFAAVPLTAALLPPFGASALGTGLWTPSRIVIECRTGHDQP